VQVCVHVSTDISERGTTQHTRHEEKSCMYQRHKVVFVGSLSGSVQTQVLVYNRADAFINLTQIFKGK